MSKTTIAPDQSSAARLSAQATEFAAAMMRLTPRDRYRIGRLVDVLATENKQTHQPFTARFMACTHSEREQLLDELDDSQGWVEQITAQ